MPYLTLTSHNAVPIARGVAPPVAVSGPVAVQEAPADGEQDMMAWCKVDDFKVKLEETCRNEAERLDKNVHFEAGNILIENYAGVVSRIFNVAQVCTLF